VGGIMKDTIVKEGADILKKLSPKNQAYFMSMLRLAEVAEEGAKNEILLRQRNSHNSH